MLSRKKLEAAEDKLWVDVGFHGGVIPGNENDLAALADAGVVGFKAFMIDSGLEEFPASDEATLRKAMPFIRETGRPLLLHAELDLGAPHWSAAPDSYAAWVASRPVEWEAKAVALAADLADEFDTPVHIVHVSCSEALTELREAQQIGIPITAETCPHYLHFAQQSIPDGDPRFKCAPPIRERMQREILWNALKTGVLTSVVSDHSPTTPENRGLTGGPVDLQKAWGGISSLQLGLSITWTGARKRKMDWTKLPEWMCENPAALIGVDSTKGKLKAGYDADIVIWSPEAEFAVKAEELHHRHSPTPYEGQYLYGRVQRTLLRGRTVFDGVPVDEPRGRIVRR